LLDRGVLVRDVGIPHHLRVTAGTPDETSAFLRTMADLPHSHRQQYQRAEEARA
jgi:histidinol-phosphate aminotransferase